MDKLKNITKTVILAALLVFLFTSCATLRQPLDLSLIQSIDNLRGTTMLGMEFGVIELPENFIDTEMAHYMAMNVAYAQGDKESYEYHYNIISRMYTDLEPQAVEPEVKPQGKSSLEF